MKESKQRAKVAVRRSSAGLGLFAEEAIAKGAFIIEYTGDRINDEEAERRWKRQYLFFVHDDLCIDGTGRENTARYINHACRPNAEPEHDEDEHRIYIYAKRNIKAGEEITYHYGKEFFNRFIKPKGCQCTSCQKKAALKRPVKKKA